MSSLGDPTTPNWGSLSALSVEHRREALLEVARIYSGGILLDKQVEQIGAMEDVVFNGGGAGSGKTRGALLSWAARGTVMPGYDAIAIRRTFPQAREIISLAKEMFIPAGASWKESEKTLTLPTGSSLEVGYLEGADDHFQYQGRAWSMLIGDEAQHHPEPRQFDWLLSRIRSSKNYPLQQSYTSNPKGVGMAWLKDRFVKPAPTGGVFPRAVEFVDDKGKKHSAVLTCRHIPSTVADNQFLANTAYVRNLMMLPESERKALLYGSWDSADGMFFTEWDARLHTVQPFPIPHDWPRSMGGDWGTYSPYHFVWIAEAPNGEMHVYREFTGRLEEDWKRGTGEPASWVAQELKRIEREEREYVQERYLDSSCWDNDGTESTVAGIFELNGLPFTKGVKSGRKKAHLLREVLKITNGRTRLKVHNNCRWLIKEFETAQHDPHNGEQWDERGSDHGLDALKYRIARNIVALDGKLTSDLKSHLKIRNQKAKDRYMGRRHA